MYDDILIPTDGSINSRRAIRHAVALAESTGATLHGLYVIEDSSNPWRSMSIDDQLAEAEDHAREVLQEVEDAAAEAGVAYEESVEIGHPIYEQINDYVEEADIDLMVVGSGYHGEIGGILGSTADKLVRTAHVPVLVLRRLERE